jgi:hypothetical protein
MQLVLPAPQNILTVSPVKGSDICPFPNATSEEGCLASCKRSERFAVHICTLVKRIVATEARLWSEGLMSSGQHLAMQEVLETGHLDGQFSWFSTVRLRLVLIFTSFTIKHSNPFSPSCRM